jgi:hypothetical protein
VYVALNDGSTFVIFSLTDKDSLVDAVTALVAECDVVAEDVVVSERVKDGVGVGGGVIVTDWVALAVSGGDNVTVYVAPSDAVALWEDVALGVSGTSNDAVTLADPDMVARPLDAVPDDVSSVLIVEFPVAVCVARPLDPVMVHDKAAMLTVEFRDSLRDSDVPAEPVAFTVDDIDNDAPPPVCVTFTD